MFGPRPREAAQSSRRVAERARIASAMASKVYAASVYEADARPIREEISAVRSRLRETTRFVLLPTSSFVQCFDKLMLACVATTAVLTPLEIAFLPHGQLSTFVVHRFTDFIFLVDLGLQFFLAYYDPMRGNILIMSRSLICKRYLSTWFLLDLVSCIPFDLLTSFSFQSRRFRILILVRLVKLIRVARLYRLQKRWEQYAIFSIGYASMSIMKLFVMVALFAHWSACLWGVQANTLYIGNGQWSWIRQREATLRDGKGHSLFAKSSPAQTYFASLYFAIYTMTGIGYGDISATTHRECVTCVFIMASSAIFWAFIIGNFCSIIASMTLHESQHRQRLDELNNMMADRRFPRELRDRCRSFLLHTKEHQIKARYQQLEGLFSISLRGDVAVKLNSSWIGKVWYFRGASKEFIMEVSQGLNSIMYAPMETIDISMSLFVLQSGIAARKGAILAAGSLWGHEFIILEETYLIDKLCAVTLSYALVLCLSRDDIFAILEEGAFEYERRMIYKASSFYRIKMRLHLLSAKIRQEKQSRVAMLGTSKTVLNRPRGTLTNSLNSSMHLNRRENRRSAPSIESARNAMAAKYCNPVRQISTLPTVHPPRAGADASVREPRKIPVQLPEMTSPSIPARTTSYGMADGGETSDTVGSSPNAITKLEGAMQRNSARLESLIMGIAQSPHFLFMSASFLSFVELERTLRRHRPRGGKDAKRILKPRHGGIETWWARLTAARLRTKEREMESQQEAHPDATAGQHA